MFWHRFTCLLRELPTYYQIALAVGFFIGSPMLLRRLFYVWVFVHLDEARSRDLAEKRSNGLGTNFIIPDETILFESKPFLLPLSLWRFFVKRANKWNSRRLSRKKRK